MRAISRLLRRLVAKGYPQLSSLHSRDISWDYITNVNSQSAVSPLSRVHPPFHIYNSVIDKYSYVCQNSYLYNTSIGKFCSIGPNCISGWGVHPIDGISTAPMFFSKNKSNGTSLSSEDKVPERKAIVIGHDVWIGMNVCILDGITIGNGAIIGAGAVVTKDVEPFSIVGGVPAKLIRFRFDRTRIEKLQRIRWWEFEDAELRDVEKYFFSVDEFIEKYKGKNN